jgi:geranylgeranyl diphosphate synthase type II
MSLPSGAPQADFEAALEAALARSLSGAPAGLSESIRYSLLAPGKRIRPRLALAAGRLAGLDARASTAAAVALEMLHCFTLIHDDLPCMDDDDFRRGMPSNHKRFGEAVALLAGDALLATSVEALGAAAALVPGPAFARALARFCRAAGPSGVIGGQAAELELPPRPSLEALRAVHAGKTGALFSAAILVPADLAGVDEAGPRGTALARFAEELGLAFQVADDLEDGAASAEADSRERNTSILAALSPAEAARDARERLAGAREALAREWGTEAARDLGALAGEVEARLQ